MELEKEEFQNVFSVSYKNKTINMVWSLNPGGKEPPAPIE
jgi:hypothetical protein